MGSVLTASFGVVLTVACLEGISDHDLEGMIGCGHRDSRDSIRMELVGVVQSLGVVQREFMGVVWRDQWV